MARSAEQRRAAARAQRRNARERQARARGEATPYHAPKAIRTIGKRTREEYLQDRLHERLSPSQLAALPKDERAQLARAASLASWGKADPRYEEAFKSLWYHSKGGNEVSESNSDDADRYEEGAEWDADDSEAA